MQLAAIADGQSLLAEFPPVTRAQWRDKVESTKAGSLERLHHTTEDGLSVAPLYTADDATSVSPFVGPAATVVGRLHVSGGPEQLATALKRDAERGVELGWIRLGSTQRGFGAGAAIVPGAELSVAGLSAVADAGAAVMIEAGAVAPQLLQKLPADHRIAGLLADPIGTLAEIGGRRETVEAGLSQLAGDTCWAREHHPALATALVDTLPYHDAGATDAQEIGIAVATGIEMLRAFEAEGHPIADLAARTVMLLAVDQTPLAGIAKLRAARMLWTSVLARAGVEIVPRIYVRSSGRNRTRHDVANNLLRATLEAFAAATGGADGALILPHTEALGDPDDDADDDAVRLAINTQLMLRDESRLSAVADPAAGSWAIEARTRALAEAAWTFAQTLSSAGGVTAALVDGSLRAAIERSAAQRKDAVARRGIPITGVTVYPDLTEATPSAGESVERVARSGLDVQPLLPVRLAAPFEGLRDAAEGLEAKAALVQLAEARDVRPQVDFASGVLAAGGIASEAGDEAAAKGAAVAVLCGSAEHLEQIGADAARRLREDGVGMIVVAGKPTEALKQAGVDAFVHRGVDLIGFLEEIHRHLNIGGAA